ncbi:MAG: Mut7-C RNAse domain-containing protein [Candidatus Methanomethylicaceae archaeon]
MRFVVDVMLGKLARWLRLLGYDTIYDQSYNDEALLKLSKSENRILITRDVELFKRASKEGISSLLIHSTDLMGALSEISPLIKDSFIDSIGTRCTICNTPLVEADRSKIPSEEIPNIGPLWSCPRCGKVYWHGSHWKGIEERIKNIKTNIQDIKR